jgi:NAD(P)-dependent dehydrogenase (short-subunit alcohol dehydrogenase family)
LYFVTGATGFIGRFTLERLLQRKGTIHLLVRPQSVNRMERILRRLDADPDRVAIIEGDITKELCGLDEEQIGALYGVKNFIHLGAVYDIRADAKTNHEFNVRGTRNAVALANKVEAAKFHHISSIAVAGRYNGVFTEDMFDEGQDLKFPYDKTKYEAERIVREECDGVWRVYRPSIVVGSAKTGEMDKIDGPYMVFGHLKRLAMLPSWIPLPGVTGGTINMVPVDFVADAIDLLVHRKEGDYEAFHLVDPYPPTLGQALSVFAAAANAPRFSLRTNNTALQSLPRMALEATELFPPARVATDEVLNAIGMPRQMVSYLDNPTKFDASRTLAALDGTDINVPPLESYAKTVWDYWERNFDPHVVKNDKLTKAARGKVVVVTGASSGIGEAVAYRLGHAGAKVVLVSRSRDKLEVIADEIRSRGGEAYVHPADLSDMDDITRVGREILEKHDRVDVLINNAGRSIRRSVANSYDRFHDFERTMQLNYFGALKLILAVLPGMRERGFGRIINVSSVGVQSYPPRFSSYVASKSALDAFSRCISSEVVGDGVNITTVYMPLVRTPMIAPTTIYKAFPAITPQQAADLVLKGVTGKPRRITSAQGTFGEVLHAVSPRTADFILSTAYRLFPESSAARGRYGSQEEMTPEAIAFAHVMRGVHW